MCNNKWCYWQYNGSCTHESEEGHENATPNQLNCPSALRADFETEFYKCQKRVILLTNILCFEKLRKVEKLMIELRKEVKVIDHQKNNPNTNWVSEKAVILTYEEMKRQSQIDPGYTCGTEDEAFVKNFMEDWLRTDGPKNNEKYFIPVNNNLLGIEIEFKEGMLLIIRENGTKFEIMKG